MLTLAQWVLFAITGRIIIYTWFQFPIPPAFEIKQTYFHKFIKKLHSCDLCSGVWIYSILALATNADMSGSGNPVTIIATGILTSFAVHIFVMGLKEKFAPTIIA